MPEQLRFQSKKNSKMREMKDERLLKLQIWGCFVFCVYAQFNPPERSLISRG